MISKLFWVAVLAASLGGCTSGLEARVSLTRCGIDGHVGVPTATPCVRHYGRGAAAYRGYPEYAGYPAYPRYVNGGPIAPRVSVIEHPPGTPDQYRCDAATGKPANPGNAWCDHTPRHQ